MARSIDKTKFALKLKAEPKNGMLTLRVGVKKYVLPFEVRFLKSDDYLFVHIPPTAEVLKPSGRSVEIVTDSAEGEKALASFKKPRKRKSSRSRSSVAMPDALSKALSQVPSGYKLGYDATGNPRLVRTRVRGKK